MAVENRAPILSTRSSQKIDIFLGSCSPVQQELSCELQVTAGEVPKSLTGTLFRNGPGRFAVGADAYSHPFDGDGMISSFQISAGKIHFRNAYVKTTEFLQEEAAGRMLFRGFGSNRPGGLLKNVFRTRFKNAANTNIIFHAGKLLALWEGGWPHEISPPDLKTNGRYQFGGKLKNKAHFFDQWANPELPFSAHPKVDPATGNLYNFGLAFGLQNRLMLYEVTPDGHMKEPRFVKLKDLSFVHDFLITSNSKAILFCTPVHFDLFSMITGLRSPAEGMKGDPSAPVRILVIDLQGPSGEIPAEAVQVFEAPYSFVFHHVNAFERDGNIHIYSAEMASFPSAESAQKALRGTDVEYPMTSLAHYTLTPSKREVSKEILPIEGFELPRLEASRTGLPFTHFYVTGVGDKKDFPFMNQIQKVLIEGKIVAVLNYPSGLVGEPVLASSAAGKFVLSVCYNHELRKSELLILNAEDLSLLAKAQLPHSQPLGFHGGFVPVDFSPRAKL